MIRKAITIALFATLATAGIAATTASDAHAQRARMKVKKKRTVKKTTKRTTKKRTTRRSGVNVRVHVGSDRHHHRYRTHRHPHTRYHRVYRHRYPRYHYHRHTTVVERPVVIVQEPQFVPPDLDCPIRTDEVTSGLEQWCATPFGNRHGPYRRWYDDGNLAAEGEYAYNLKIGVWIEFHPNGAVRSEGEYDDGEKIGLWTTWAADGTQLVAVEY